MAIMYSQEAIIELRNRLGLSVAEFATRLGVHRTTVYYWESGHSHPRYREQVALNKLAEELGQAAAKPAAS